MECSCTRDTRVHVCTVSYFSLYNCKQGIALEAIRGNGFEVVAPEMKAHRHHVRQSVVVEVIPHAKVGVVLLRRRVHLGNSSQFKNKYAERFRRGLVFQAQRLLCHSIPGSRVMKKKKNTRGKARSDKLKNTTASR